MLSFLHYSWARTSPSSEDKSQPLKAQQAPLTAIWQEHLQTDTVSGTEVKLEIARSGIHLDTGLLWLDHELNCVYKQNQPSCVRPYGKHIEIRAKNGISPIKPVILIVAAQFFVTLDATCSTITLQCTLD